MLPPFFAENFCTAKSWKISSSKLWICYWYIDQTMTIGKYFHAYDQKTLIQCSNVVLYLIATLKYNIIFTSVPTSTSFSGQAFNGIGSGLGFLIARVMVYLPGTMVLMLMLAMIWVYVWIRVNLLQSQRGVIQTANLFSIPGEGALRSCCVYVNCTTYTLYLYALYKIYKTLQLYTMLWI